MPKFPRLVAPGYPHHVTQRGIRKQQTFFDDSDYRAYIDLIKRLKVAAGVNIWAYCLMPNHVHLIAVPEAAQPGTAFWYRAPSLCEACECHSRLARTSMARTLLLCGYG